VNHFTKTLQAQWPNIICINMHLDTVIDTIIPKDNDLFSDSICKQSVLTLISNNDQQFAAWLALVHCLHAYLCGN